MVSETSNNVKIADGEAGAKPSEGDHAKISRERSLQWQEVNSLLEDEIGRMRAQLIKSRSIRRENQATVDKLVSPSSRD